MKGKPRKILSTYLILMFMLSLTMTIQPSAAQERQKIYVDPPAVRPEDPQIGDTFTINVMTANWVEPGLWGYQFELHYDPEVLQCIAASIPDDHWLVPEDPDAAWLEMAKGKITHNPPEEGYVEFAGTMTAPEPGHTGGGLLCTMEFQIVKTNMVKSDLELWAVILLAGGTGAEVPTAEYDVEHGLYSTLPPPPWLKVDPPNVFASEEGQEVPVSVTIQDLLAGYKLLALGFKLKFNQTLLKVLDVAEGDFLKSCAENAGEDYVTSFLHTPLGEANERGYIHIGLLYNKDPYPPEIFPEGSGNLATITFNATDVPEPPIIASCDLVLDDVIMVDVDENPIELGPSGHGHYETVEAADLNGDGKIDILDMAIIAAAFGSYPGHPRWNPRADINGDEIVNILDGVRIALAWHP